jgi:hypothetical protein
VLYRRVREEITRGFPKRFSDSTVAD